MRMTMPILECKQVPTTTVVKVFSMKVRLVFIQRDGWTGSPVFSIFAAICETYCQALSQIDQCWTYTSQFLVHFCWVPFFLQFCTNTSQSLNGQSLVLQPFVLAHFNNVTWFVNWISTFTTLLLFKTLASMTKFKELILNSVDCALTKCLVDIKIC